MTGDIPFLVTVSEKGRKSLLEKTSQLYEKDRNKLAAGREECQVDGKGHAVSQCADREGRGWLEGRKR